MSSIEKLKEQMMNNPELVNPEANLVLSVLQQLEELEATVGASTLDTLLNQEDFQKLKLELEETKAKLEQAIFLKEPLNIPESFEEDTNVTD